jgi:hypothetical protein
MLTMAAVLPGDKAAKVAELQARGAMRLSRQDMPIFCENGSCHSVPE